MSLDIAKWLADIGLGQYADTFSDNDIDFDILQDLTDADLDKLARIDTGNEESQSGDLAILAELLDLPVTGESPLQSFTPAQHKTRTL